MESLAIWYEGNQNENAAIDIHVNFWKLPSRNDSFHRFLDIGINLHDAFKVEKIFLYFPLPVALHDIGDLGAVISHGSANLLTAIFNEDYQITSAAKSDYHEVRNQFGEEIFNIYEMNISNFLVVPKHEGTLFSITLPAQAIRKQKTYLRFRVQGKGLAGFSEIERNYSSFLSAAFTKMEILDFRINSARYLPNKLLEEMNQSRSFIIRKIHFFYICSYRENYVLSHRAFFGARKLEDKTWNDYISAHGRILPNPKHETIIAYHWKEKAEHSNRIDDFNILLKTSFRHNDWVRIAKYVLFLLCFSVFTGIVANFLFSRFINSGQ